MKTKELIQIAAAVLIFAIAGFLIFSQLQPKKGAATTGKGTTVIKVTQIEGSFDQAELNKLSDSTINRDFYTPPDLNSGLGNNSPFKPIQ